MKIMVEVTADELARMRLDSVAELEEDLRDQLDNSTDDQGEAGVDWMVDYDLEVSQLEA